MKESVKFSIITCAYNATDTIMHAVESVLCQTYKNYEYIILENGSTDGITREYIKNNIEKLDERIRVIYIDDNIGWSHGTSICLKEATGDYMTMLAADDYLADEKVLETVAVDAIKNPDIIFTGFSVALYDSESDKYSIMETQCPKRMELYNENKIHQFENVTQSVYYNSMFHYEKVSFLRENKIDFYDPFYCDCEGMTEAIAKANHITVIDMVGYVLTYNTSQTRGAVIDRNIGINQWNSVVSAIKKCGSFDVKSFVFLAYRILANVLSNVQNMCDGCSIRNVDMKNMNVTIEQRREIISKWINNVCVKEMCILEMTSGTDEVTDVIKETGNSLDRFSEQLDESQKLAIVFTENDFAEFILKYLDIAYEMKISTNKVDYLELANYCIKIFETYFQYFKVEDVTNIISSYARFAS